MAVHWVKKLWSTVPVHQWRQIRGWRFFFHSLWSAHEICTNKEQQKCIGVDINVKHWCQQKHSQSQKCWILCWSLVVLHGTLFEKTQSLQSSLWENLQTWGDIVLLAALFPVVSNWIQLAFSCFLICCSKCCNHEGFETQVWLIFFSFCFQESLCLTSSFLMQMHTFPWPLFTTKCRETNKMITWPLTRRQSQAYDPLTQRWWIHFHHLFWSSILSNDWFWNLKALISSFCGTNKQEGQLQGLTKTVRWQSLPTAQKELISEKAEKDTKKQSAR